MYRILKPGGIFSIGVPYTEWPLRAYFNASHASFFQFAKEKWHAPSCTTKMEHINYHFRQDAQHSFVYDFETLKYALGRAGFSQIERRGFDPLLDSQDRELGTLYVNAVNQQRWQRGTSKQVAVFGLPSTENESVIFQTLRDNDSPPRRYPCHCRLSSYNTGCRGPRVAADSAAQHTGLPIRVMHQPETQPPLSDGHV